MSTNAPVPPALPAYAVLRLSCRHVLTWLHQQSADARLFQILFLGSFLLVGVTWRDFSLHPAQVLLTFSGALLTQRWWLTRLQLQQRGYLSAIVTSFGLCILVRADSFWVHPLLACVVISSKFVLRIDGRHLFNPANFGAILALWVLPGAWLSPGQWGQNMMLAAWFVALGGLVARRAQRLDIGWTFLACYLGLVAMRVFLLGQSWAVWMHQMQNGALLLFSFFMISDPLTTPRHPLARLLYAVLVAGTAFSWQYMLFKPNGPVICLFLLTPLVPLLNRCMPGQEFSWRQGSA